MRAVWSRIAVPIVASLHCAAVSAQVTQRVSLSSRGVQANAQCWIDSISPDGRYVLFSSRASNLVPGDGFWMDVFLRDRRTGITERVSVNSSGAGGNAESSSGWSSADGRYVSFTSYAFNLVPNDTNDFSDAFVRDRVLGTTERVSVSSAGAQGNNQSVGGPITPDGRYVVFHSTASNLVPGDTNGMWDVFVRDRWTGRTERVSVDSNGVEGDSWSMWGSISDDGRCVSFESIARNLVAGDSNASWDTFVRDRQAGTTERVSVASDGTQGYRDSYSSRITADGRYVAFESMASDLVPGDTNGRSDVFVHDRVSGRTERVSLSSGAEQGDGDSSEPSISGDGRYVAFGSWASNLVPGDTNGARDIFVRDRQRDVTERVSISSVGSQGSSDSGAKRISANGRFVAFDSFAPNLVPGDTNVRADAFVRDRLGGTSFTSLCEPGMGGVVACPCANPPAGLIRGCDNSSATGGATLAASGGTFLSSDSLMFTTGGEKPTATSIVLQGNALAASGVVYGQGVRCVGGSLKRLFVKTAIAGSITAPDFGAGDPTVSARSAAKGDVIQAGQSRYYLVYYRDPTVLGGCPASSTFNATQTGQISWSP